MRRDIIIATVMEKLGGKYHTSDDALTVIQEELGNNFQIFKDVDLVDEIHQLWDSEKELANKYKILYNGYKYR
jgi:hypothetical protein